MHGLRALGLERGDAVAVCLPNCAEFYALYLACLQAGFYLTPINWHLAGPEIAYIVSDSGAKAFIGHERIAQVCRAAADEIDFPKHGALRDRHASRASAPFAELIAGQPDSMPAQRSRRHGDELHLGHDRQAEGRARARWRRRRSSPT